MKTLHKQHIHRAARAGGAALALLAAGCGGGGGGASAPTSAPVPAQTTAALQGIWQSAAGAASAVSAIALPNGQVWSIVSAAGTVRLVKVDLALQNAGFGGAGTSYTLGGASAGATVSATVVEKGTLTGTIAIAIAGGQPEAFALAYQSRYDTAAALADFAGDWQAALGPGTVNWSFGANGALSGTRTTGCTYTGQLALRAEAKAVVDVAVLENCAGASTALQGVAVLSADRTRISMATTTADGAAAVVLSLAH